MALARQSRNMNKIHSGAMNKQSSEVVADSSRNCAIAGNRNMHRKRKLSTLLGSKWSKKEIEHFYKAYRKYGKNWKKVAGVVRSRTKEMVEALYEMNRVYLSLPDGAATVVGLIAMVTDHYYILDGREQESKNESSILQKPQKWSQGTFQPNILRGSIPRRKRTPRFPVSYPNGKDDVEKCTSPNEQDLKLEVGANVGEPTQDATLMLLEALLKEESLDVSQTRMRQASARNGKEMQTEPEMVSAEHIGTVKDKGCSGGPSEVHDSEYGDFMDTSDMMETNGIGSVDIHIKMKRFQGKKIEVQHTENNHFGDFERMCSGSGGFMWHSVNEKNEAEFTLEKAEQSTDSFLKFKKGKRTSDTVRKDDEPEVISAKSEVGKPKSSDAKEKGHEPIAKLEMGLTLDGSVSEVKNQLHQYATKMGKRNHDKGDAKTSVVESVTEPLLHITQNSSTLPKHNTCKENTQSLCLKPVATSVGSAVPLNFCGSATTLAQGSGFGGEVFEFSQLKACRMVDVAIQVATSLKEGEDNFEKIGEALEYASTQNFEVDCDRQVARPSKPSDMSHHHLSHQYQATSCTSIPTIKVDADHLESHNGSEQIEIQIPSGLISSCVATLLMIQTCTDRRHPPAEVAQILDSATMSLRPHCCKNLPIYRDIQMCMGMVKNQILALIPS